MAFDLGAFDLNLGAWTQLQPPGEVPAPRFGHTATWVADVGLVVWSGQGNGADFFDDIWAYDPAANEWRQLPSLGAVPPARYGSCASIGPDGELWISHGFTEDSGRFSDTRSYDFGTALGQIARRRGRRPRLSAACMTASGRRMTDSSCTAGRRQASRRWEISGHTTSRRGAWTVGPIRTPHRASFMPAANDGQAAIVFGGGAVDRGYLADTWWLDSATLELSQFGDQAGGPPVGAARH